MLCGLLPRLPSVTLIPSFPSPNPQLGSNDTIVHTLGYADDAALIESGEEAGVTRMSCRVTEISNGSREDADMQINVDKTKVLHVRQQQKVSETTELEAKQVCKFECPHTGCNFKFNSKRGMQVHAGRCRWKDECELEKIVECVGPILKRRYKVRWKGYGPEEDTWQSRTSLHPQTVKEFEIKAGKYDASWPHRCSICDHPCRSQRGVSIHAAKAHRENDKTADKAQNFVNSKADKAVRIAKWEEQQSERPKVVCEMEELENVFRFKYLGTLFAADGEQSFDIKARIAMAMQRCGQLGHMFNSEHLGQNLKIRLYVAAVLSLLTYGCETWLLDQGCMRTLNGANSQMLARVTGESVRSQAKSETAVFDLVKNIRRRRLRWLGQILRGDETRLLFEAMRVQYHEHMDGVKGTLFMDAPASNSFEELILSANDKVYWKALEQMIPSHLRSIPKGRDTSRYHFRTNE